MAVRKVLIGAGVGAGTIAWILLALQQTAAGASIEDAAEAMFQRGLADMLAGRYASGCPAIAESLRLEPRPGTLFTLAECEARAGLMATALGHYQTFLRLVADMPLEAAERQRERRQIAIEQQAKLSQQVAGLTVRLPREAPPGTVVKRDGVILSGQALGTNLTVDPGPHAVTATAPGALSAERRFVLSPGERKELTFAAAELATNGAAISLGLPASAEERAAARRLRWKRWGTGIAIGGLVLAAAGGAALLIAKLKIDAIEKAQKDSTPYDPGTGNYPAYQTAGVRFLASAAAALIAGGTFYLVGSHAAPPGGGVAGGVRPGVIAAVLRGTF